jgi:alkylation response protein AidB-like acyl-CoA dehydrogenase
MVTALHSAPPSLSDHGGDFLHRPVLSTHIFTPEQFTEEQKQFRKTAADFSRDELMPHAEELDHKKPGLMPEMMQRAALLGLFMVEVPEAHGGLALDKVTSMLIAEELAKVGSFAVTYGAHTGIGTLPLVFYGTQAQQAKFLPKLASGEWMAAYALSEQGSGSDALGAKTTARLHSDGKHYVLSGSKQWITNAAWADVFTVFAQVDGTKFTAFLVERKSAGLSIGHEERKLGIRGSSTCQLILDDVLVPVDHVLGEVGRGHKIAFNILNIGRYKLGASSIGAAKTALQHGVTYAKDRRQFKKAIATFGLIRQKIAHAATLIYAGESMAYRLAGHIDRRNAQLDKNAADYGSQAIGVIDDFTMEASILKIMGSEALYHIADEMLQVHGGNGYTEDYPMERFLRDARINRIFEGTNEINRLIIPATLLKRAMGGTLPLMDFAGSILEELKNPQLLPKKPSGPLGNEILATELTKRAVVFAASYAAQKYMEDLKEKQAILGVLADCMADVFGMDSVVSRAHQAVQSLSKPTSELHVALTQLYCFDARARVFQNLRRIAMIMADGEELDSLYDNFAKLDQRFRVDCMALQEVVADKTLQHGGYPF